MLARFLRGLALLVAFAIAAVLLSTPAGAVGTSSIVVTINPGTGSIVKGSPSTYTITVTNRGPSPAPNTVARVVLLSDPNTFTIKFPSNMPVGRANEYADWRLGTLAVNQTATASVVITGLVVTGSSSTAVKATLGVEISTDSNNPLQYDDRSGTFARHISITTVAPTPQPTPTPTMSPSPTMTTHAAPPVSATHSTTPTPTSTPTHSASSSRTPAAVVATKSATVARTPPAPASSSPIASVEPSPYATLTAVKGRPSGASAGLIGGLVLAGAVAAAGIVLLRRRLGSS